MGIGFTTLLLFGGLIFLLAMGVPVVFALGGISVLITFLLDGTNGLYIVATTTYRQITDPGLITIPLFLLMGNFLIHSGISDRLFRALNLPSVYVLPWPCAEDSAPASSPWDSLPFRPCSNSATINPSPWAV
ncbi:MAG: TRAP transporter large permease subunit [Planctomycetota bacterium]